MTKVIILEETDSKKELKPIKFVKEINSSIICATNSPSEWENIELITRNYNEKFDLMFAYDHDRSDGIAYYGYFNDGIVE